MLGLPMDNKESYLQSLDYVINIMKTGNHFLGLYQTKLLIGTKLNEIKDHFNMKIQDNDLMRNVYKTSTMPRNDMIECLKFNTLAYRIMGVKEIDKTQNKLKEIFFKIKGSNIDKLYKIGKQLFEYKYYLRMFKCDYPNAENYYLKEIFDDVSDDDMIKIMNEVIDNDSNM